MIVHGAGRVPELSRLGLDAAEVAYGDEGVNVAGHLQSTTNSRVYAAGDSAASPGMPLTPVAVFEGKVAASNMLENTMVIPDYDGVPTVVFTIPELARVGLLEDDARASGIDLDVRYRDTSGWYSNDRVGESTAAVKILVDSSNETIVGVPTCSDPSTANSSLLRARDQARAHHPATHIDHCRLPDRRVRPGVDALSAHTSLRAGEAVAVFACDWAP